MDEHVEHFRREVTEEGLERLLRSAAAGHDVNESCEAAHRVITERDVPLRDEDRARWARLFMACATKTTSARLDEIDRQAYTQIVTPRLRRVGELLVEEQPAGVALVFERFWTMRITSVSVLRHPIWTAGMQRAHDSDGKGYVVLGYGRNRDGGEIRLRPVPATQFASIQIGLGNPGQHVEAIVNWLSSDA